MGACKIGYLKKSEIRITLMIQDNAVRAGGGITIFAKVDSLHKAAPDNRN